MTTKLQTYPKLKPSGIDWLGDIPIGWNTKRNLGLFSERNERVKHFAEDDFELLSVTIKKGVVRQLELAEDEQRKDSSNEDKGNYKWVRRGDIAYNKMRMWQGAAGESKHEGIVSPAYIILKPKTRVLPRYFHYFFRTEMFNEIAYQYGYGIADDQHSLRYWQFKTLYSPFPPLKTQKQIAEFLDEKTKVIDELVAKKEKLIGLLREKRAALITHAVTKGLDPNAKLKPSGIDWLGDIPEGWNTKPFTSLFRERSVSNGSGDVQNVLSLSYGKIVDRDVETNFGLLPTSFNTYQIVESGWIVFRLTDLQNDHKSLRTGLVTKRGIITSAYLSVEPTSEINQSYASFLLHSYDLYKVFYSMGGGVRQTIGYAELKWMPIVLPPLEVQNNLVKFLDAETAKIDKAVALIESQIEKLKKYRSSLIYHAVTGKIKV